MAGVNQDSIRKSLFPKNMDTLIYWVAIRSYNYGVSTGRTDMSQADNQYKVEQVAKKKAHQILLESKLEELQDLYEFWEKSSYEELILVMDKRISELQSELKNRRADSNERV